MNIRRAILKAADHLASNPQEFNFNHTGVPACGTPGCALGWIGCFAGLPEGESIGRAAPMLGIDGSEYFYDRCIAIGTALGFSWWSDTPEHVVAVLRAYADKYHPVESPALIPDSVRRIFLMTPEEIGRELERA